MSYIQIISSILVLTVSISGVYLVSAYITSENKKSKRNSLVISAVFAVVSLAISVFGLGL